MAFESWQAYDKFASFVRYQGRFALGAEAQSFLREFRMQATSRALELEKGSRLFRAENHVDQRILSDGTTDIVGASEDRIRPKIEFAQDGRINVRGIPCLYLASSIDTAISEVRPWLKEMLSVATFETSRSFRLVDLSKNHGKWSTGMLTLDQLLDKKPVGGDLMDACVWTDIDNAFSAPVSLSDSRISYVPTQILAEALRTDGFEGVVYKSSFGGEKGYNIALFDGADTLVIKCAVHEVRAINIDHAECGNPWFRTKATVKV